MLVLNKYGGAEGEKKRQGIKNYMKCVVFMMLFVLMVRKDPGRSNSWSKFWHSVVLN